MACPQLEKVGWSEWENVPCFRSSSIRKLLFKEHMVFTPMPYIALHSALFAWQVGGVLYVGLG